MSQQFIADGFAFAREGGVLEGTLKVSDLVRLHDLLAVVVGEVHYQLQGYKSSRGQSQLHLQVSGELSLVCQRCLKPVPFALEVDSLLELVPESADLTQGELEDDSRDFLPLPLAGTLDVAVVVEDEILLTLPVLPRHEICGLPSEAEAGERLNPFAALSALKGKLN